MALSSVMRSVSRRGRYPVIDNEILTYNVILSNNNRRLVLRFVPSFYWQFKSLHWVLIFRIGRNSVLDRHNFILRTTGRDKHWRYRETDLAQSDPAIGYCFFCCFRSWIFRILGLCPLGDCFPLIHFQETAYLTPVRLNLKKWNEWIKPRTKLRWQAPEDFSGILEPGSAAELVEHLGLRGAS